MNAMLERQRKRLARLPRWISWLVYGLLAVLMTWPLALHLSTRLGGSDPDLFNVYWGNWWVHQALTTGQNPYMTRYLIYPQGFDLTTFAFSPLLALLSIPLNWVVSPVVGYNLLVWVTIVLCCVAMDELVRYLTGNAWAALVAGLTFGFAPCLAAERAAHLNMALVAWIPWSALFLTRLLREARIRDAILLAGTIGLAFLTRLQVGVLVLGFDGIYVVGLALVEGKQWHKRAARRALLAGLLCSLFLVPLASHVLYVLRRPGGQDVLRYGAENYQTDLVAYVVPPPRHPLFGRWTAAIYGRFAENAFYWAFLGFVPLGLVIYAGVSQTRKAFPWLLCGTCFVLLALGPRLRFNGKVYGRIELPYGLAPGLFSTMGFDVPNRFNLALVPAVGVLVGLACARISERLGKRWVALAPATLILFEYLAVPMKLQELPPHSAFYDQMAADPAEYAIVDLPLTREAGEMQRYYQTIHHKPIVGGWDWRVPGDAFAFIDGNALLGPWRGQDSGDVPLDVSLRELASANVRYVVVHKDELGGVPASMEKLVLTLRPVYEDGNIRVLEVETASREQIHIARAFGPMLALAQPSVSISTGEGTPGLLLNACWLATGATVGDAWRVRWLGPDGSLLSEEITLLAPAGQDLACKAWLAGPVSVLPPGDYQVRVELLSDGQPVGDWEVRQSLQVVQDSGGKPLPLIGRALPVAFDAPIEMLAYNAVAGDGLVWVDLYWRNLGEHGAIHASVQLVDPATRARVAASDGLIPGSGQGEIEILQEHRLIMVHDVLPGQYSMEVVLYDPKGAHSRIGAKDVQSGEPLPGDMVVLDVPVLVVPSASEIAGTQEGRLVVRGGALEGLSGEPQHPVSATFGGMARLVGYGMEPQEVVSGGPLEVDLYWKAINGQSENTNYTVFVHLLDGLGKVIAQHDGQPAAGRRSTRTWKQGDELVDVHHIVWLTQGYEGMATIEVGLYNPQTQERVPAYGPQGERLPEDRVILGQVSVRSK